MDNKLRSKTRLAAIQLVSQQLLNKEDIDSIKNDFDKYYRNTVIDENLEKIQYNINFLSKLITYYKLINFDILSKEINQLINFERKFEKWDVINQAIISMAISEIRNSENKKIKIISFTSGSKVLDWNVPLVWEVKDSYIEHIKSKKKFAIFSKNNLNILNYSQPKKTISYDACSK